MFRLAVRAALVRAPSPAAAPVVIITKAARTVATRVRARAEARSVPSALLGGARAQQHRRDGKAGHAARQQQPSHPPLLAFTIPRAGLLRCLLPRLRRANTLPRRPFPDLVEQKLVLADERNRRLPGEVRIGRGMVG